VTSNLTDGTSKHNRSIPFTRATYAPKHPLSKTRPHNNKAIRDKQMRQYKPKSADKNNALYILQSVKDINHKIPFGKHKGKTLKQVAKSQPNYIHWIFESGAFKKMGVILR